VCFCSSEGLILVSLQAAAYIYIIYIMIVNCTNKVTENNQLSNNNISYFLDLLRVNSGILLQSGQYHLPERGFDIFKQAR